MRLWRSKRAVCSALTVRVKHGWIKSRHWRLSGFGSCSRYRHFKGLSGADVAKTFDEYGIYEYITKHFESLHTMGDHCIVQDIDDYIGSITGDSRMKA
nr:DUF3791 domain-containing protein [uncultured Marvinbryantia sp.]